MKNLKKIVTLAALALALTLSLASAKEANAATTMTKKQVAKAIAAAQEKAINKRKIVKVTVTFETKKSTYKYMDKIDDLVAQEYWGKLYGTFGSGAPFAIDSTGYYKPYDGKWRSDDDETYYDNWTKDGSKYTVIFKFMGNHKVFDAARNVAYNAANKEYCEKIYDALVPTTAGMTQAQKVCYVMDWFCGRISYTLNGYDISAKAIWNGTAYGKCENYSSAARTYLKMVGVKHVAEVTSKSHSIVAVRLEDNRIYFIEPQSFNPDSNVTDEEAIELLQRQHRSHCVFCKKAKVVWEDGKKETITTYKGYYYESKYSW